MIKAKWLYSELPLSLDIVTTRLLAEQYSDDKGEGFLLNSSGKNFLSGRYIEKIIGKSIVTDPFGNQSEQTTVAYYTCKFNWQNGSKLLCITEPPRSLRKFLAKLHNLLGLGVVVADIDVDPLKWLQQIESQLGRTTITHISSLGIHTPVGGLAKISVSGKKDIRTDFEELISNRRHKIDNVKFNLKYSNDIQALVELTGAGSCKLKSYNHKEILEKFRLCLELIVEGY
ncbi:hypothetical protein [Pelagibaculum spongiae]|uniref:Uncharacterized protein n=1 Tax=Pelagibaculum spongiae TaxID=2080658 RepID=A0A2V1H0W6_9GAMM|nr:hypothetical protein [Pelagibaculum spongiae]PVZ69723.1 hypothetical protein DC094_10510 [Pelagibaculum spongiae]